MRDTGRKVAGLTNMSRLDWPRLNKLVKYGWKEEKYTGIVVLGQHHTERVLSLL